MSRLLLRVGKVLTMDPSRQRATAVGIGGDRIVAVGDEAEVRATLGPGAEEVALDGALLPGFIDPHHHYCMSAFERRLTDLRLSPETSIEELVARLEHTARTSPGAPWIRGQGYDRGRLRERRVPRIEELDEAVPDRPLLIISYSFHEGCLNSRGLEEMGWSRKSPDPRHGRLVRDRGGRLTGEIGEGALFLAEARSRGSLLMNGEDAWLAECEAHGRELLRAGITRVGDAAVPPQFERLYLRAVAEGRLPVSVHRMPLGESIMQPRLPDEPTGAGPDAAPAGAAKVVLDGAERCAMCVSLGQVVRGAALVGRGLISGAGLASVRALRLSGRVRLGRDGHLHTGTLYHDRDQLRAIAAQAAGSDLQLAIHAVGNEAARVAIDALGSRADRFAELPGHPRLEHLVFIDPAIVSAIVDAGAFAVVQPRWAHELGDELLAAPLPSAFRRLPLRSLLRGGVGMALSSDYPAGSFDVLAGIESAVTRRTRGGAVLQEEEAISVSEALHGYTRAAAAALGAEDDAGTISPGKRADLVLLSADPLATNPDRIRNLSVLRTYVGGSLAFSRN